MDSSSKVYAHLFTLLSYLVYAFTLISVYVCVCYFLTVIVEWTINCSWHWIFSQANKQVIVIERHQEEVIFSSSYYYSLFVDWTECVSSRNTFLWLWFDVRWSNDVTFTHSISINRSVKAVRVNEWMKKKKKMKNRENNWQKCLAINVFRCCFCSPRCLTIQVTFYLSPASAAKDKR